MGLRTVPVYEIYKVGAVPHWLDGLDLTGAMGLRCVVIPHFDDAEGGTHDTRFCYLGERRLSTMEADSATASVLLDEVAHHEAAFDAALADDDAMAAADAVAALEETIHAWRADVNQSDEMDRARQTLHRLVLRLARTTQAGLHDHRQLVAPLVASFLEEAVDGVNAERHPDPDRQRRHHGGHHVERDPDQCHQAQHPHRREADGQDGQHTQPWAPGPAPRTPARGRPWTPAT